jgi:hypothetical protein
MATRHFSVRAVPHQGFDGYFRAGHRWTDEPTMVSVTDDGKPGPGTHSIVLSPQQLAQLRADKRVMVESAEPSRSERKQDPKDEGGK